MRTRFTPSMEMLGDRLTPGPLLPAEQTRQVSVVVDMSPESGDECLVFFLGGIPSGEVPEYVYGTELPGENVPLRPRTFSLADRTGGTPDGVVLLASSLPDGDVELARETLVTTLSMDMDLPAAPDGRHFKMLFAPLVLELDVPPAETHFLYQDIVIPAADPFGFAGDGRASGL